MNLNEQQIKAVKHMEGPCLVVAGAGSGKTKVLTERIANLIKNNINSYNILAITFTNKAAKEMKERLNKIVDENFAFVGTFHSLGVRILKENSDEFGLKRNFTILDSDDSSTIIKKIMKDFNINPKELSPAYVKNKISFIKNELLSDSDLDKYFNTSYDKDIVKIYHKYNEILKNNNTVDFDDLLKLPVELFIKNKEILNYYQEKYKYILVDEYQDTNEVQYKLIKLLSNKYHNIFVVGDQNQSIYGFRNANYKNINNFELDNKDTKVIVLNKNYRSTNNILKAANEVISNNTIKKECDLFSDLGDGVKIKYYRAHNEKQEVSWVCDEIEKLINDGYQKKDIAIFYRTNAQSRLIEEAIMKKNLPYKIVGSYYFYKRKEIKDLISYLKLISNPNDDISLARVINEPKRGIGTKTIEDLSNLASSQNKSIFEIIETGKCLEFKNIILDMIEKKNSLSLTELTDYVLEKSGMLKALEDEKTLESEIRIENLMEFKSITENYQNEVGTINLEDFLDDISLVSDVSEHKDYDDVLTLMTIHSSKGLEFKVVFIIGMEEGILPHQNSFTEKDGIEEERRLCYVAITRAKERLYLTNSKMRMLYGNTSVNPPSRFIDEINTSLIEKENEEEVKIKEFKKEILYSDEKINYKNGEVVYHLSFGRGVVVNVDDRFVTVAFEKRYGIKKFLSNYKGLKRKD